MVAEDNRCVRVSVQSKKKKKTYKNESLRVGGCSINGVLHGLSAGLCMCISVCLSTV